MPNTNSFCKRITDADIAGYDDFVELMPICEGQCARGALDLAYAIGIDYDGYRTAEGLKGIVDELMACIMYARRKMDEEKGD